MTTNVKKIKEFVEIIRTNMIVKIVYVRCVAKGSSSCKACVMVRCGRGKHDCILHYFTGIPLDTDVNCYAALFYGRLTPDEIAKIYNYYVTAS